jgi:choline dehydrogenase-like flavoprotein
MNHPISIGVTVNLTRSSTVPRSKEEWLSDIRQYEKTRDGPLSTTGTLQLSGYIPSSDATDDYPDLKFEFAFSDVSNDSAHIPASYYSRITVLPSHLRPKSRGFFTINSTDSFDPPLIYPNLLENPEDRKPLIEGQLFAFKLANTKAFKESGFVLDTRKIKGCKSETFGTYQYFNCVLDKYVEVAHHMVGTCKMGNSSDTQAVVDPEMRVYGVRNLRVVDASIMPVIPSANTNAPTIMIGEKASDLIKMAHRDYNKASKCK